MKRGVLDSAETALNNSYSILVEIKDRLRFPAVLNDLAKLDTKRGNSTGAMSIYRKALSSADPLTSVNIISEIYTGIANLFRQSGKNDSCIFMRSKDWKRQRQTIIQKEFWRPANY